MHTYGNNKPYDCPNEITVDGKVYSFCGSTVTMESTNCLACINPSGEYVDSMKFDSKETAVGEAFNRYEAGKEYYVNSTGSIYVKKTNFSAGDIIADDNVFEYDSALSTLICKTAYVQDNF